MVRLTYETVKDFLCQQYKSRVFYNRCCCVRHSHNLHFPEPTISQSANNQHDRKPYDDIRQASILHLSSPLGTPFASSPRLHDIISRRGSYPGIHALLLQTAMRTTFQDVCYECYLWPQVGILLFHSRRLLYAVLEAISTISPHLAFTLIIQLPCSYQPRLHISACHHQLSARFHPLTITFRFTYRV